MGFLNNAGVDRLWKKFKSHIANYLPLTGGTMKGLLNVPYGTAVHYTQGTYGTNGYFHVATIVVSGSFQNVPMEMTIVRRHDTQPTRIVIHFSNEDNSDPIIQTFSVFGATADVWIYKSATSTWELYVKKTEGYDRLGVTDLQKSEYLDCISITWQKDQISTLPDGAGQATVREFLGVASKSAGIADYNDEDAILKIGYAGSSLDTSNLAHLAGYTADRKIKDVDKDAVKSYLGIDDYATHTHGEATLTWGGKNIRGDVGPVGAALSAELSANRLALVNGNALTIEYSKDGGTTWNDYGLTDNDKSWLCTCYQDIPIGRVERSEKYTTNSKTRITIFAQPYFYTNPKKLLVNMSVSGITELLIEYKKGTDNAEWETYSTTDVSGWSGWNDVDLQLSTLGGNSYQQDNTWYLRLTFSMKSVDEDYATTAYVRGLRLFGTNDWGSASEIAGKGNLSSTGHVYSYDVNANVTFPAVLAATTLCEGGVNLWAKYQPRGTLTLMHGNECRFDKPNWDAARELWFGYAWSDGTKEALITRYIFGNGNGHYADIQANRFYGDLSGSASEVNGHTVDADVPSDAKFTDTTYSAFRGTEGMSDGTSGLVPAPKASEFGNSYALSSDGKWRDFGQTFVSQSFADGAYATNDALENAIKELKKYVDTQSSGGVTLDSVYPVGSIYISVNDSFNPNDVFPGTWVSFGKGRTLVGVDRSDLEFQSSEDTGGEKTHTLTVEELPAHDHSAITTVKSKSLTGKVWNFAGQGASNGPGNSTSGVFSKGGDANCFYPSATKTATGISDGFTLDATHDHTASTVVGNTGSGTAHNNMMPYITVYMWKRTA